MVAAIQAVRNGVSKKLAAKTFGVPRSTLVHKLNNRGVDPQLQKVGRTNFFTTSEEGEIATRLINVIEGGIVKKKYKVAEMIKNVVNLMKDDNPFKTSRPSAKWLQSFMHRHPNVTVALENIHKKEVNITAIATSFCYIFNISFVSESKRQQPSMPLKQWLIKTIQMTTKRTLNNRLRMKFYQNISKTHNMN